MSAHLNLFLVDHPAEAELVAIMLAGYGELEFELYLCLAAALGCPHMSARILYRLRSESNRLETADAILRTKCAEHRILPVYETVYGAMKWCKSTRNRYAHCHWIAREGVLCFFDLESSVQSVVDPINVRVKPVDVPLLAEQVEFFHYTRECFVHLEDLYRQKSGGPPSSRAGSKMPKRREQPKPHNPLV